MKSLLYSTAIASSKYSILSSEMLFKLATKKVGKRLPTVQEAALSYGDKLKAKYENISEEELAKANETINAYYNHDKNITYNDYKKALHIKTFKEGHFKDLLSYSGFKGEVLRDAFVKDYDNSSKFI
jgi:hypothetical protein